MAVGGGTETVLRGAAPAVGVSVFVLVDPLHAVTKRMVTLTSRARLSSPVLCFIEILLPNPDFLRRSNDADRARVKCEEQHRQLIRGYLEEN